MKERRNEEQKEKRTEGLNERRIEGQKEKRTDRNRKTEGLEEMTEGKKEGMNE